MRPVLSLGYLRIAVADLSAWKTFLIDFIGLMEVDGPTPDAVHLRLDDHAARIVLTTAEQSQLLAAGYEVLNETHLDELAAAVSEFGIEVTRGSAQEAAERQVRALVKFTDPGGNPVELYCGPLRSYLPMQSPVSRFITGDQGMGHIITNSTDVDRDFEFYTTVLGFEDRNTMELPHGRMYFMSPNPRQHTLGLHPAEAPGLMHLMFEAATIDDVGAAMDRRDEHGIAPMQSLGRHTNDDMVSFYVWSPDLQAVEFGYGATTVHRPEPSYQIAQGAYWGHKFTPPPTG